VQLCPAKNFKKSFNPRKSNVTVYGRKTTACGSRANMPTVANPKRCLTHRMLEGLKMGLAISQLRSQCAS
jgi:hypothetical protein